MKIEITQIQIKLKDRTIELDADEARLVADELNKLFNQSSEPSKEYVPVPFMYPTPIIVDRGFWWPLHWDTGPWCGGTTGDPLPTLPHTLCISLGTT